MICMRGGCCINLHVIHLNRIQIPFQFHCTNKCCAFAYNLRLKTNNRSSYWNKLYVFYIICIYTIFVYAYVYDRLLCMRIFFIFANNPKEKYCKNIIIARKIFDSIVDESLNNSTRIIFNNNQSVCLQNIFFWLQVFFF